MAFAMFAHFVWDSATALASGLLGNPGLGITVSAVILIVGLLMVSRVARKARISRSIDSVTF
jgi:hypothetical protein